MSCKFFSTKTIWILLALLLLMSILTLYTLFANSIFGMNVMINDIDSAQPIIVDIVDTVDSITKKQNPWTSKMVKAFLKAKNTKSDKNSDKYKEYEPSITHKGFINKISKKTKPSKYTQDSYTKHKPFTFLVGMDRIKQEYNRTISNLQAIDESNITKRKPINIGCEHKGRVFVLGIMKTGTTSMVDALNQLGYHCTHDSCIHLGNWFHFIDTVHLWQPLEVIVLSILNMTDLLHEVYLKETRDALAFGDSPWCFLYPVWDKLYPDSKYILMTRKDDETYINSYLRYLKKFGKKFVNKGLSNTQFALIALRRYHLHNQMVREYFKDRPDDLLQIEVGATKHGDEWNEIVEFLGCRKPERKFPHENKSNRNGAAARRYVPIKIHSNDSRWDWRQKYGDNIPYVVRDELEYHTLHEISPDEFVFDWNLFLVDELKVSDPLSSVNV